MWLAGPSGVTSPRSGTAITPRPTQVRGANIPSKYSSLKGRGFSCFEYFEQPRSPRNPPPISPRPQLTLLNDGSSPQGGGGILSDRPIFKHSALPPAPQQAGSFQRFRYSTDPYELNEDYKRSELRTTRTKTLSGAFSAGGNARDERRMLKRRAPVRRLPLSARSSPVLQRSAHTWWVRLCLGSRPVPRDCPHRSQELKAQLMSTLRSDWSSFLSVTTDERGVVLALFAADRLNAERRADLHDYMNRLLSTHPATAEFGLNREAARWGATISAIEAGGPAQLVFALRPPWVPNDLHAEARKGGGGLLTTTVPAAVARNEPAVGH